MAEPKVSAATKGALATAVLLTLACVAAQSSALSVGLVPLIAILLIFAMTQVPLRYSIATIMFFAFILENPDEAPASGLWSSPFIGIGAVLLTHLNTVDRSIGALSWCSFSGMDVLLGSLFLIAFRRKASRSKIDSAGRLATPKPLIRLAYVSLAGMVFVWLSGLVRGGDLSMSLWQINRVMYLPVLFLLFSMSLRGPKDHKMLAKVVLGAATFRALWAVYVLNTVDVAYDKDGHSTLAYATSHNDSMLFAMAFVLAVSILLERLPKSTKRLSLILLPIIALGIKDNGRRMAWVQVGVVLLTVYLITEDNPVKRRVRRTLMYASPVILAYFVVGWNAASSIFKPVKIMRSVVDAQSDSSTLWRELENFDLIATVRMNPVLGTGYGNGYVEVVKLPEISYSLERFVPHNSILGLWCYCGYFGYTALTLLWAAGVYFAMRAHKAATEPSQRVAATACFGAVLVYLVQCWGDMGLGSWTGVFIVAPSLAVAGKLAVATGQWGSKKKKAGPGAVRARAVNGVHSPGQAA